MACCRQPQREAEAIGDGGAGLGRDGRPTSCRLEHTGTFAAVVRRRGLRGEAGGCSYVARTAASGGGVVSGGRRVACGGGG